MQEMRQIMIYMHVTEKFKFKQWWLALKHSSLRLVLSETSLGRSEYILREISLAINFGDSRFRRNRIFNFKISKIYVDKRLQVQ